VLYIITESIDDGPCKIGISGAGVKQRCRDLQVGNPRLLIVAYAFELSDPTQDRAIETAMHAAMWPQRLSGEWFSVMPDSAKDAFSQIIVKRGLSAIARVEYGLPKQRTKYMPPATSDDEMTVRRERVRRIVMSM
jgi:hypothetical protein